MKYAIDFNLMEMAQLVYACNYAVGKERQHFVQIYEYNCKAREAIENVKRKMFVAMHEDNNHIELDLMEIVQLYSACNMAWHHEKDEMPYQHESKIPQYRRAIEDLEYAREKILAALNKGGR